MAGQRGVGLNRINNGNAVNTAAATTTSVAAKKGSGTVISTGAASFFR
jgi:hypothetical protein